MTMQAGNGQASDPFQYLDSSEDDEENYRQACNKSKMLQSNSEVPEAVEVYDSDDEKKLSSEEVSGERLQRRTV